MDVMEIAKRLVQGKRESEERVAEAHRDGNQVIYGGYSRVDCDAVPEVEEEEEIFDLGKPLTCLMITCRGCTKIDPVMGCVTYEDPSLLSWHRHGEFCPFNPPYVAPKKKKKVNPLKASKQAAKE